MGTADATSGRDAAIGLVLLLVLAAALSVHDARRDSATFDEPNHLVAGVVLAQTGAATITPEHPPLARHVYGLLARAAGATDPPSLSFRDFLRGTRDYLARERPGVETGRLLLAARMGAIAFFLLLLAAGHAAAGGGQAGLLAVLLLLGNIALFPHGHLATTDIPFAAATLVAAVAFVRFVEHPTHLRAVLLAVGLAAAVAVKYSGLLLLGMTAAGLAAAALSETRRPERRRLAAGTLLVPVAAGLLACGTLGLYARSEPPGTLATICRLYRLPERDRELLARLERVDRGLARIGFGLAFTLRQTSAGRPTYFLGRVEVPGPHYHMVTVALKSPLAWLLAIAAGFLAAARGDGTRRARLLLGAGLLFFLLSLPGPRIGVRHVFPAIALLSAGAAAALSPRVAGLGVPLRLGLAALLLAPLATNRSLGALNLVGRSLAKPPLADSNLDWGQDLLRLRDELARRGVPAGDVSIAYFGGDRTEARIPGVLDLVDEFREGSDPPPRRWLAVSRQLLLAGPEAAILPTDTRRLAELLGEAASLPFAFRAGDSIDVFERPGVAERQGAPDALAGARASRSR